MSDDKQWNESFEETSEDLDALAQDIQKEIDAGEIAICLDDDDDTW